MQPSIKPIAFRMGQEQYGMINSLII